MYQSDGIELAGGRLDTEAVDDFKTVFACYPARQLPTDRPMRQTVKSPRPHQHQQTTNLPAFIETLPEPTNSGHHRLNRIVSGISLTIHGSISTRIVSKTDVQYPANDHSSHSGIMPVIYSKLDASPLPFLHLLEVLKHLDRTGWKRWLKHPESVAAHMYRLAFLVMFAPVCPVIP
jgi:hypothetical protein